MSRLIVCAVTLNVWVCSASAQKVFTPAELDKAMKTVGIAFDLADQSVSTGAYPAAKLQLLAARQVLMTTKSFWLEKKQTAAVELLSDTVLNMDALDATLSASHVDDASAVSGVSKTLAACTRCHERYRSQDPITKAYILNPASLK